MNFKFLVCKLQVLEDFFPLNPILLYFVTLKQYLMYSFNLKYPLIAISTIFDIFFRFNIAIVEFFKSLYQIMWMMMFVCMVFLICWYAFTTFSFWNLMVTIDYMVHLFKGNNLCAIHMNCSTNFSLYHPPKNWYSVGPTKLDF